MNLQQKEHEFLTGACTMEPGTLTEIYQTFSPGIYRYAMRLLGDESLAEDCLADTFSRFLKALQLRQGPSDHLQAYLYRIAHNWITDFYRRQTPLSVEMDESIPTETALSPENIVSKKLEQERIRLALRSLTSDQRMVVILRFFEDWSYAEISAAVQKPEGTIRAMQFRALQALRSLMNDHEFEAKYETSE